MIQQCNSSRLARANSPNYDSEMSHFAFCSKQIYPPFYRRVFHIVSFGGKLFLVHRAPGDDVIEM